MCQIFSAMLSDMFSCSTLECHGATHQRPVLVSKVVMRQNMIDFISYFFLKVSGEMLKYETFGIFHKFYEKYAKKMLILDMR